MWKRRERKPLDMDADHMKALHLECYEQLDLMRIALEASEIAAGTMRDNLDSMVENHWHGFLDVMHMIMLHDESFAAIMKKPGMALRTDEKSEYDERPYTVNRLLLIRLVSALARRHQRLVHVWSLRGSPMSEYYKSSMMMEREHIVELISLIQGMV